MRLCLGRSAGSLLSLLSFSLSLVDAALGVGVDGAVVEGLGRGCEGGGRGEEGRDSLMSDDARFSSDVFVLFSDLDLDFCQRDREDKEWERWKRWECKKEGMIKRRRR